MKKIFAVSASIEFEHLEHTFKIIEGEVIKEREGEYACNTNRGIEWVIKNKLDPNKPYEFNYYGDGAYLYFWGFEYDEDNKSVQKNVQKLSILSETKSSNLNKNELTTYKIQLNF